MNFRRARTGLGLAATLSLGACSSWIEGLRAGVAGTPVSSGDGAASGADAVAARRDLASIPDAAAPAVPKRAADPFDATGPANEGSLWNGDSQDGFYFSKNVLHKVGDILIVKIEPEVNDALNLKIASVVGRDSVQQVAADEAGKAAGAVADQKVTNAIGNANVGRAVGNDVANRTVAALDSKPKYVDIDEVSVRIVEMLPHNSYRVDGSKRVFVKNTPYLLRYTGVIRDEDLGPATTIASGKVIDSKMEMAKGAGG